MTPPLAREILDFWFGPSPHIVRAEWFRKDAAFDAAIRERFGSALEAGFRGDLDGWQADPHGALAHVVLLDQFTRNSFRGTPRAFAGDSKARITAMAIVEAGVDRTFDIHERQFAYLPFEHAEDVAMQQRAIVLFAQLAHDSGDPDPLEWAEKHAAIIRRFGRFPHRNEILGRLSTPDEALFLQEPGSSF